MRQFKGYVDIELANVSKVVAKGVNIANRKRPRNSGHHIRAGKAVAMANGTDSVLPQGSEFKPGKSDVASFLVGSLSPGQL